MRASNRRLLALALSLLIFAGAMWLALRLSFPPDPMRRHSARVSAPEPAVDVGPDQQVLTVRTDDEVRSYRLFETRQGLVAREVDDE